MSTIPLILVLLAGSLIAADDLPPPSIAPFAGDRAAAVSFTFDDGPLDHYAAIAPVFDRHGLRATFFVVVGAVPEERPADAPDPLATWAEWRDAAARGHEIGNHSWSHVDLRHVGDDQALRREIVDSRDRLAERVGVVPRSFAYPFCKRDARVEAATLASHAVARGYHPLYEGAFPPERARAMIEEAIVQGGWHVHLSHGVDPVALDTHLAWLRSVSDRVWVDTYGRVGCYVREREQAVLTVVERGEGRLTCTLLLPGGLDPLLCDVPLTVIVPVAGSPASAQARRDGIDGGCPVVIAAGRLLVDAVPGPGAIHISWH